MKIKFGSNEWSLKIVKAIEEHSVLGHFYVNLCGPVHWMVSNNLW